MGDPTAAICAIRKRAALSYSWRARGERPAGVVTSVAVCTLLLASCSAAPTTSSTPTEPVTGGQVTPLLDSTLSTPRWFTGSDGQAHLVYELMLTNVVPAAVTINTLEVRDADSGATLLRLTGDSLRAATSLTASPETPGVLLPPSSVGVVWVDAPLGVAPLSRQRSRTG